MSLDGATGKSPFSHQDDEVDALNWRPAPRYGILPVKPPLKEDCMSLAPRQQNILDLVRERGYVSIEELEKENTRLKRVVADMALDNAILKDVASGNF